MDIIKNTIIPLEEENMKIQTKYLRRNYFNIDRSLRSISYKGISKKAINTKQKRVLLELSIQKYFENNIEILNKKYDLKLEIQKRP